MGQTYANTLVLAFLHCLSLTHTNNLCWDVGNDLVAACFN